MFSPLFICTLTATAALAAPAPIQPPAKDQPAPASAPQNSPRRQAQLESAWVAAFNEHNFGEALRDLNELAKITPGDAVVYYNIACIHAILGHLEDGEDALRKCLELGFTDFNRLIHDDNLARLRGTDTYAAVLEGWKELQQTAIDARLERYRQTLKGSAKSAEARGYSFTKDEDLRLAFVSGFRPTVKTAAVQEIKRVTVAWEQLVLPEGEHATSTNGKNPDNWVLVFLPTAEDFNSWAENKYGSKATNVGGAYEHARAQLVARDIGPTLRHEYWHVLHWRHMTRTGKYQPVWVQEGLCSVIEDVRWDKQQTKDGDRTVEREIAVPLASWRTNMAQRMMDNGLMPRLPDLLAMSDKTFVERNSLGNYAVARTFFMWLYDQGKLKAWYTDLCSSKELDALAATERVLGKPAKQLDADFRTWLKAQKRVGEMNGVHPLLPATFGDTTGEGLPVVAGLGDDLLRMPLRPGDLVIAVDGEPTPDHATLARVLGAKKVGDVVEVTVRRGGGTKESKVKVKLIEPM